MATIEKRINQSGTKYRVRIRKKGYPPVQATFGRKSDAQKWASQTETEINEGRYFNKVEARKHTFSELADRFIASLDPTGKSTSKYTQQLTYWKERIGDRLLLDVSPALIGEERDFLLDSENAWKQPHSPANVNRYLAALSTCFTSGVKEYGWIESNPVMKVKRAVEPKERVRFLSDDSVDKSGKVVKGELTRLLEACRSSDRDELYPVVLLLLATGARREEVVGLRWSEVNLREGVITFVRTKSGKSRSIPISGEALQILKQRDKVRRLDTDLIFPAKSIINRRRKQSDSDPERRSTDLRKAWTKALRDAEIEDFRMHDLRHTAASYLAMAGVDMRTIAEILGHSNVVVTQRYAHLTTEHLRGAIDTLAEAVVRK